MLGFSSAIGAYGGFFIPKSYGTSITMTGGPEAALYVFIVFYLTCIAITWWFYCARANAMLSDADRALIAPARLKERL